MDYNTRHIVEFGSGISTEFSSLFSFLRFFIIMSLVFSILVLSLKWRCLRHESQTSGIVYVKMFRVERSDEKGSIVYCLGGTKELVDRVQYIARIRVWEMRKRQKENSCSYCLRTYVYSNAKQSIGSGAYTKKMPWKWLNECFLVRIECSTSNTW